MKGSLAAILRVLVLPFGATTGKRIVLDGINGEIDVYDAANTRVGLINENGFRTDQSDGSYIALDPQGTFGGCEIDIQPPTVSGITQTQAIILAGNLGAGALLDKRPYLSYEAPNIATPSVKGYPRMDLIGEGLTDPNTYEYHDADSTTYVGPIHSAVSGPSVYFQAETWNNMTLQNGWTAPGGADPGAKYRKIPSPANCVQIVMSIAGGTNANGTTVATLPVGYRPTTHKTLFPVAVNGIVAGLSPRMELNTAGQLVIDQCTSATNILVNTIVALDV